MYSILTFSPASSIYLELTEGLRGAWNLLKGGGGKGGGGGGSKGSGSKGGGGAARAQKQPPPPPTVAQVQNVKEQAPEGDSDIKDVSERRKKRRGSATTIASLATDSTKPTILGG